MSNETEGANRSKARRNGTMMGRDERGKKAMEQDQTSKAMK
jgi:hypothetical protein